MQFVVLCVACLICLTMMAGCASGDLKMLRTEKTRIVDDRGHDVQLRGVNLGGWLVEEMWMMPFVTHPPKGDPEKLGLVLDHVSLWRVIDKRLGTESAARVRTALREAWVNESDFERIHAAGMNCIRLPFLSTIVDEPGGIDYLDRALAWAEKRGIYVILDMHGAPGCQSKDHHSGETDRNEFFLKSENVEKAAAVWQQLARRYKDRRVVAGYDLLNEPMGAPNPATMHAAHDRLYRAIRAVDQAHIIFIEDAYKGANTFPLPSAAGWENVVYSVHVYGFTSQSPADQMAKLCWLRDECEKAQDLYGVPMYVGEFNQEPQGTRETMQAFIGEMLSHKWAYSIWTYKIIKPHGTTSMWGNYRNPHPIEAINPFADSEADMLRKVELYRTEKLEPDARLVGVLGEVAGTAADNR